MKPPKRDGPFSGFTRERVLMVAGLIVIGVELVNSEVLGGVFHFEFLIAGLALCGISITSWGDKQ